MNATDITIIADNGGGLTLQVGEGDARYQHTYDDASHCANDIRQLLAGETAGDWDGNEADCWLEPTDEQIRSGGYKVLDAGDLMSLDPENVSGYSLRTLVEMLAKLT